MKDLHNENYKPLTKEAEENTQNAKTARVHGKRDHLNVYAAQSDSQIQCTLPKISHIFKTKTIKFFLESQQKNQRAKAIIRNKKA